MSDHLRRYELRDYFAIPHTEGLSQDGIAEGYGERIRAPVQTQTKPRGHSKLRIRRDKPKERVKPKPSDRNERSPSKQHTKLPKDNIPPRVSSDNVRFRRGKRHETHSVIAILDNPMNSYQDVYLVAVGEDGREMRMGIRAAYINNKGGKRLKQKSNSIPEINRVENLDRISVEFITREPIIDKSFALRHREITK